MLYAETEWSNYIKDNEFINFYINLRNITRYIKENKNNLNIIDNKRPNRFFKKISIRPLNAYNYINLHDTFDMDRISYYYRQILDRFESENVNDLSTFFKLIDDFSDFLLFIDKVDPAAHQDKYMIAEFKDNKKVFNTGSLCTITIEQSVIENINKSGSVILDLLDNKDNDKYITFYTIDIYGKFKGKFITGEDPKLSTEEKIVISNMTDNLLIQIFDVFDECLLYRLQEATRILNINHLSNYLKEGIIITDFEGN